MVDVTNSPEEQAWWRRVEEELGLPTADDEVRPDAIASARGSVEVET